MPKDAQPREWIEGAEEAADARLNVAEQVWDLLLDRQMTGSEETLGLRLREMLLARRSGDAVALRAAVLEVSVSAAAYAVQLDLSEPSLRRGA